MTRKFTAAVAAIVLAANSAPAQTQQHSTHTHSASHVHGMMQAHGHSGAAHDSLMATLSQSARDSLLLRHHLMQKTMASMLHQGQPASSIGAAAGDDTASPGTTWLRSMLHGDCLPAMLMRHGNAHTSGSSSHGVACRQLSMPSSVHRDTVRR